MDESNIVKNIRQLSSFIDDAYIKSEEDKYVMFQSNFKLFHKQIELVYEKWFPKAKPCKDVDIINQVFRNDIDKTYTKHWVKYSMACLLNSSKRVYENIIKVKTDNDNQLFLCEMNLLKEMSFEAAILMETGFEIVENKSIEFGYGKRLHIYPRETFNASRQLLRKQTARRSLGDFVFSPSSIFLIRQSIELWLQTIFAINVVTDNDNKLIKLQPERLFDLIDNKGIKVETPVPKAVIQKIHQWTQSYVHAGWIAYTWEIEHAQHVLAPIFNPSNIIIDRFHFDNIEKKLQKILDNPQLKLHRLTRADSKIKE